MLQKQRDSILSICAVTAVFPLFSRLKKNFFGTLAVHLFHNVSIKLLFSVAFRTRKSPCKTGSDRETSILSILLILCFIHALSEGKY